MVFLWLKITCNFDVHIIILMFTTKISLNYIKLV